MAQPATNQKQPPSRAKPAQPPKQQPIQPKPNAPQISAVQIEGLVLLRIIQHCGEYLPRQQAVTGKLLGLRSDAHTVEVTNCFPLPFSEKEEATEKDRTKARKQTNAYSQKMISLMQKVREDNNNVGWYRSALNGAFLSKQTIDGQFKHQTLSPSSVCIIYDPTATNKGRLVLRAFRLTDSFMAFYTKQEFGATSIQKHDLTSKEIFEELDVKIHNSHLLHAFLYELTQGPSKSLSTGYDRLHHAHDRALISNLKQMSNSIDQYAEETLQFRRYWGACNRNKIQKENIMKRYHQDRDQRLSRGQKPKPRPNLSRDVPNVDEPARLTSVTLSAQMNEYCEEIETTVMQGLVKLWLTQGIQSQESLQ